MLFGYKTDSDKINTVKTTPESLKGKQRELPALTIGEKAPAFSVEFWEQLLTYPEGEDAKGLSLAAFLQEKPLVLSFFDLDWKKNYAELYLEILERAYTKIKAFGGDLLVLALQSEEQLKQVRKRTGISFGLFQDIDGSIASKYGVFSKEYPTWQRISGINNNIVVPGTFVIDRSQSLIYTYIDETFHNPFITRNILEALYKVN